MSAYTAAGQQGPIGVFDSGLGGLTAVRELGRILPGEDIIYFGDTGRVPYGTKGRDIITAYAGQDIAFLLSKKVKCVLAACGTVSSTYPAENAAALPVPYFGVVAPTAMAAAAATKNGVVGVIGTEATIATNSYQNVLAQIAPDVRCTAASCPLFVPLVENGHFENGDEMARLAAEEYLAPIKNAGVDTLILGCTHYPLLAGTISAYLGDGVTLIDSGKEAARALKAGLAQRGLLKTGGPDANPGKAGTHEYYVSDEPARFSRLADIFLGGSEGRAASYVNIDKYSLDWIMKGWLPGVE